MQDKVETLFREALSQALPDSCKLTVFENQDFEPPQKKKHYQFHFMPSENRVATLGAGGSDWFAGVVQIDICIPINTGKTGLSEDVDALRAKFKAGSRLIDGVLNVTIMSCGRSGPGFRKESFHCYPVTIQWETRIPRN